MDAQSLPDLAQLLTGAIGPSTRAATCTAIAACSAGKAGAALRRQVGTTTAGETIIRRLLTLSADPVCTRLALSALVNLSEDEQAVNVIIRSSGVERCANALLDEEASIMSPLYSGLLSNLTRFPPGVDALVGKDKGTTAANVAVHTLLKLVAAIDVIPNVLWMSNACSTAEGRAALLLHGQDVDEKDHDRQPLTWLLRLLSSTNDATRLAAASAMRNCAMADDCHDLLVRRTNSLGVCLSALIGPSCSLVLDDIQDAPTEVRNIVAGLADANPEKLVEIRLLIVESLLLLCKTLVGRTTLRERDSYLILHEWNKTEPDDQVKHSITSILQRIMTEEEDDHSNPESTENGIEQSQNINTS